MESEWIEEPVFNIASIYYTSSRPCKSNVTSHQVLPTAPQAGDPQFHLWNLSRTGVTLAMPGSLAPRSMILTNLRGGVGTLSLSLSLVRMEHISMTLVSHKMCEQHLLSLIINMNMTIPSIFHYHACQKRTQTYSQLGILSIPTRSNNDLDYVTSRLASADVKPGRVTLQVTMGTPSSAVGRLSKNVKMLGTGRKWYEFLGKSYRYFMLNRKATVHKYFLSYSYWHYTRPTRRGHF